MTDPFRERSIVVTGASAGIGRQLALDLARQGAFLTLAARRLPDLETLAQECRALGGRALAVSTDVADPEACRTLVAAAAQEFGGIDVLVNNAGLTMRARFEDVTDLTLFARLMEVNYLGAVYCTHHALPYLKRRGGLLVAVSSLTGLHGVPSRTGYAASKHAMQGFFDSLRIELWDSGVDVLVVSPGFVATDIRAAALGPDESPHGQGGDLMPVETCSALILEGMAKRKREVVMTARGRVGRWVKLIAPKLADYVARRAIRGRQ
jgi:NAD(P)-dependent dehydrogenase (short-subunit alcohol dehydrogenase family)